MRGIRNMIRSAQDRRVAPDAIHIATEGPIGLAVRRYCRRRSRPFTTSVHARCGEQINATAGLPARM